MMHDRYVRDPKHGQLVPTGSALTRLIAGIMTRIHADALKQTRGGATRIDLSHWVPVIVEAAVPVVAPYWLRGYRDQAVDLLERIRRHRAQTKSLFAKPSTTRYGFLVAGSPDVENYLKTATFAFAQSTLDTVAAEVGDAIHATRQALAASAKTGESQQQINERLRRIFTDPHRADRIGATEAVRISQAGSYQAAIDSGIVGSCVWMANANACKALCKPLDGKEVKLGTPFAIDEKAPPAYRVIMHPTRHPFCKCVLRMEIDLSAPIPSVDEMKIVEMTNVGKPFKIKPRNGPPKSSRFVRWQSPEVRQGTY